MCLRVAQQINARSVKFSAVISKSIHECSQDNQFEVSTRRSAEERKVRSSRKGKGEREKARVTAEDKR